MLVRISGEVKNYPWGSKTLVQDHFDLGVENQRVSEVWFGTHDGGHSKLMGSNQLLSDAIGSKLSFLVKFLAAESPLSIQVHPNPTQAKDGFARESKAGVPIGAPERNYKDDLHKPEILIALTKFEALCGFRPRAQLLEIFRAFADSEPRFAELAALTETGASFEEIFMEILDDHLLARRFTKSVQGLVADSIAEKARLLAVGLLGKYSGDTGAVAALLLNHIKLSPGQAIFLPAGNLHAYLSGLGLEVMAASDNVIRGGLTSKHIDKAELRKISDFSELSNPLVAPKKLAEGLIEYQVEASEFRVYRAEVTGSNLLADLDLPVGGLIVCVSGEVAIGTSLEEREVLKKGEVVYVGRANKFSISGGGAAFVILGSKRP